MQDRASSYRDRGVNAQLAAALLATERWQDAVELTHSGLRELIEHLWRWPTVDQSTFRAWEGWSSPVLEAGLGGDYPVPLVAAAERRGVRDQLERLLPALVEIVYSHLFAAVDLDEAIGRLGIVESTVQEAGVELVDPMHFRSTTAADLRGWGRFVDADEVAHWRTLR